MTILTVDPAITYASFSTCGTAHAQGQQLMKSSATAATVKMMGMQENFQIGMLQKHAVTKAMAKYIAEQNRAHIRAVECNDGKLRTWASKMLQQQHRKAEMWEQHCPQEHPVV